MHLDTLPLGMCIDHSLRQASKRPRLYRAKGHLAFLASRRRPLTGPAGLAAGPAGLTAGAAGFTAGAAGLTAGAAGFTGLVAGAAGLTAGAAPGTVGMKPLVVV